MKVHTDKRSREFSDEPRAVRTVRSMRLPLVRAEIRLAFALLRIKRKRSYVRHGCKSVCEWAEQEGYGYRHAKRLVALAKALVDVPGLTWLVRTGRVAPESAVWVACLFREPTLDLTDEQKADIVQKAAEQPSRVFVEWAEQAREQARQGEPTIALRIMVTRATREGFRTSRRLMAKEKDPMPTESETFAGLVRYYLEREDPKEKPPPRKPKRKPGRKRSRYVPRHTEHVVDVRSDGLCELCGERMADHRIHLVPYEQGGIQDPRNIVKACRECHFWYDVGVWQFTGFAADGRPQFAFHAERLPKEDAAGEEPPDDTAVHERAPPPYGVPPDPLERRRARRVLRSSPRDARCRIAGGPGPWSARVRRREAPGGSRGHDEGASSQPSRRGEEPVPAPARDEPGGLVPLG